MLLDEAMNFVEFSGSGIKNMETSLQHFVFCLFKELSSA